MIVQINIGDGSSEEACVELIEVKSNNVKGFAKDWKAARALVHKGDMPDTNEIIKEVAKRGWTIKPLSIDLEVDD